MKIRELLHALADEIADHVDRSAQGAEYYDQDSSPLPTMHALLVRTGKVPGFKVNRRILVRKSDMHAFIERHRVQPTSTLEAEGPAGEEAALQGLLRGAPIRRAG